MAKGRFFRPFSHLKEAEGRKPSALQFQMSIRNEFFHDLTVMGDDDHRPALIMECPEYPHKCIAAECIKAGCRLVKDKYLRIHRKDTGNRRKPLLAA